MKFDLERAIPLLERTPQVLISLLENLPKEWTEVNEGPDTWSPFDVIGHLIHGEKTDWMVRLKIIMSEDVNKKFAPYDRFAQFKNSQGKNIKSLLKEFKFLRKDNIRALQSMNLSSEDLDRRGIHPELGSVSLGQLLAAWVVHDLGHIAQVSRVMAKQYVTEVGPWPKYLTILNYTPIE